MICVCGQGFPHRSSSTMRTPCVDACSPAPEGGQGGKGGPRCALLIRRRIFLPWPVIVDGDFSRLANTVRDGVGRWPGRAWADCVVDLLKVSRRGGSTPARPPPTPQRGQKAGPPEAPLQHAHTFIWVFVCCMRCNGSYGRPTRSCTVRYNLLSCRHAIPDCPSAGNTNCLARHRVQAPFAHRRCHGIRPFLLAKFLLEPRKFVDGDLLLLVQHLGHPFDLLDLGAG